MDYLSIANRDIFVTEDGSYTTRYVYDASGKRISAEFDYAPGTKRGEAGENLQSDIAAEIGKVFYRTSILGSTLFAVDKNGEVIAHAIYDPWGNPLIETYTDANYSGLENLNNYTGYTWDVTLSLYFAQNRFYDADTHRFTQEDIVKDGANWYVYCGNAPVLRVDLTGDYYILKMNNGVFRATRQGWLDAVFQSAFSNISLQNAFNFLSASEVVGGTSYKDFDVDSVFFDEALSAAKEYANTVIVPYLSAIHPALGAAASIVTNWGTTIIGVILDAPNNLDIVGRDAIMWQIFSNIKITPQSKNREQLEKAMIKADTFVIEYSNLFKNYEPSLKMSIYDAGEKIAKGRITSIKKNIHDYFYGAAVYEAYKGLYGDNPWAKNSDVNSLLLIYGVKNIADKIYNAVEEEVIKDVKFIYNSINNYFENIFGYIINEYFDTVSCGG